MPHRLLAAVLVAVVSVTLWSGCARPVLGPVRTMDLTPAVGRAEGEINAALLRLGVAPAEVETGVRTTTRTITQPVRARWTHRAFTIVAEPTFRDLAPADYAAAVREGAGRAGARVTGVAGAAAGAATGTRRLTVEVPVRVAGRSLVLDAFEITVVPPERLAPAPSGAARVALIIDDWGLDSQVAEEFFALPVPLTMAVIPFLPASEALARTGHAHGWDVLVHLPMQPEDPRQDEGKGMIRVTMSDEEIRRRVAEDLAAVPYAVGVNNHKGSRATQDPRVVNLVLDEVVARGLFFVDSRTSSRSVAAGLARNRGVAYGENYLFLDGRADVGYIRQNLRTLVGAATRNGVAIGIAHVRPHTLAALQAELPDLLRSGVTFVPVHEVVQAPTPAPRAETPAPPLP